MTTHPAVRVPGSWNGEVFVHLVRITLPLSNLTSRARRDVSADVTWLAQEIARREPRSQVVDLLVGEILDRLQPSLDPKAAASLRAGLPQHLALAA